MPEHEGVCVDNSGGADGKFRLPDGCFIMAYGSDGPLVLGATYRITSEESNTGAVGYFIEEKLDRPLESIPRARMTSHDFFTCIDVDPPKFYGVPGTAEVVVPEGLTIKRGARYNLWTMTDGSIEVDAKGEVYVVAPSALRGWAEALKILADYLPDDNPVCAQHDAVTVSLNPERVHERDKARLDYLGWVPAEIEGVPCFRKYT